ncbi:MAG: outer membrane protein [Cyanobium sp.]
MLASLSCKRCLGIAIPALLPLINLGAKAEDQKIEVPVAQPGWYAAIGAGAAWPANPSASYAERGSLEGIDYRLSGSTSVSLSGGAAVEVGMGYDFGSHVRSELSYVFTRPSLGSSSFQGRLQAAGFTIPFDGSVSGEGSVNTNSIFISGYYDIATTSRFRPYVGGGIGWTNVSIPAQIFAGVIQIPTGSAGVSARSDGGNASAFGYQAKLGVSYLATSNTDLFLEAAYQGNTAVTIQSLSIGALNQFGVRAGIRYRFGG